MQTLYLNNLCLKMPFAFCAGLLMPWNSRMYQTFLSKKKYVIISNNQKAISDIITKVSELRKSWKYSNYY